MSLLSIVCTSIMLLFNYIIVCNKMDCNNNINSELREDITKLTNAITIASMDMRSYDSKVAKLEGVVMVLEKEIELLKENNIKHEAAKEYLDNSIKQLIYSNKNLEIGLSSLKTLVTNFMYDYKHQNKNN